MICNSARSPFTDDNGTIVRRRSSSLGKSQKGGFEPDVLPQVAGSPRYSHTTRTPPQKAPPTQASPTMATPRTRLLFNRTDYKPLISKRYKELAISLALTTFFLFWSQRNMRLSSFRDPSTKEFVRRYQALNYTPRIFDVKSNRIDGYIIWHDDDDAKKKKRKKKSSVLDDSTLISLEHRVIHNYARPSDDELRSNIEPEKVKGLFNNRVDPLESSCVPMESWQSENRPSCNFFHEINMGSTSLRRLGVGGWRDAWKYGRQYTGSKVTRNEKVIIKTLWGRKDHVFDSQSYEMHRIDAAVSDRLSHLSSVIDIYGYCGESVLNEVAEYTLEDLILTSFKGQAKEIPLIDRIKLARDVAQAVADIHDVDAVRSSRSIENRSNATAVHRDLKADNIVFVDGTVKVSDFNSAVLMLWDTSQNKQCHIRKWWKMPWFEATKEPEIYPFNEKSDIFCLGGLLFFTFTGEYPFVSETEGDLKLMYSKYKDHIPPPLPKHALDTIASSQMAKDFVDIVVTCFHPRAKQRPTAQQIATQLNALLL
jgi:hypothetical protein